MHVELGNTTQSWQSMQLPTHFKNKMERAKLHSAQLVFLEVPINAFFSKQGETIKFWQLCEEENWKKKPYRKTIATVPLRRLFFVRDNAWPHPDDLTDDI